MKPKQKRWLNDILFDQIERDKITLDHDKPIKTSRHFYPPEVQLKKLKND